MELTNSSMNERQRTYRQVYRDRIAAWYNGYLHVAIIYTIGFCALYVYLSHLESVQWWEWLAVPVVFLASNIFEWWIHAQVMHRPLKWKGARAIYTRHMLMHHQFFTNEEMRFADHLDWRVTVFPPYALVVFILISTPPALIAGWLLSANVGWLVIATTTSIYLIYEFMHFCCHIDENWFVRYCPLVNTLRRHHTAHHNQFDHDGAQHEPHVPDRGLAVRYVRSRSRSARAPLQRLFDEVREDRYAQEREDPEGGSACFGGCGSGEPCLRSTCTRAPRCARSKDSYGTIHGGAGFRRRRDAFRSPLHAGTPGLRGV